MKTCRGCNRSLPLECFSPSKLGRDGYKARCKECRRGEYLLIKDISNAKKREVYASDTEVRNKILLVNNQYALTHRVQRSVTNKKYWVKNAGRLSETNKAYRDEHRTEISQAQKHWRAIHPENDFLHFQKRKALKLSAQVGEIPSNIKQLLVDFYGPQCMYPNCTKDLAEFPLQIDHIIPLSKKGPHSVDNFQLLCKSHNSSKGNRNSIDYRSYPRFTY